MNNLIIYPFFLSSDLVKWSVLTDWLLQLKNRPLFHLSFNDNGVTWSTKSTSLFFDTIMLSGCELIDTENISLPSQNMKFGSEWAKRTSHKFHILSSRLIFFSINHIHIQMTFIILKSNINTDTSIFVFSREKSHDSK